MALGVREDVAYLLLKKINEGSQNQSRSEITLSTDELSNQDISKKDGLKNLDSLNEKSYIQAPVSEHQEAANPLPVVDFLNRIREPFKSLKTDDHLFLCRIGQEGGIPVSTDAETGVKAVFSATKEQLSPERITESSGCLPGKVKQLWEQA